MNRLARTLLPLLLITAAAQAQDKMEVKDADSNILMKVEDEGSAGSLTLMGLGAAPTSFTNKLYNIGGALFWNGAQLLTSGGATGWSLTGNAGTVDGTNFLGTTDNVPLNFRVNNARGFRLEYAAEGLSNAPRPSVIGGHGSNVDSGVLSATISGGLENSISADFAAIGGGKRNIISGSNALHATISGGIENGLGASTGFAATIAGGNGNRAPGDYAAIIGGLDNIAGGNYGVAGGAFSVADGSYSFAMGRQAEASHNGAFVWSDSSTGNFSSIAENEFAVRATGGLRFVTAVDGSGNPTQTVSVDNAGAVTAAAFVGDGSGLTNLPPGNGWSLTGNAGTVDGTNFIGTTDNIPLSLRVNNATGLRIEYAEDDDVFDPAVNVLGGSGNSITGSAFGAFVGGGLNNHITSPTAVISGGQNNSVSNRYASIGGGVNNQALGHGSTIGGGSGNLADGDEATIPGGNNNEASASYSFAAGFKAKARHSGAFVWSGSSVDSDFISTAAQQFLVRAAGGVGINKNNPATALDVNGTVTGSAFAGDGVALDILVNNARAMRFEHNEISGHLLPNVIGGAPGNQVTAGVYGATISGGGLFDTGVANQVTGNFGTIGGGSRNEAGTGGTVSGGGDNFATGDYAAVIGGFGNVASGRLSTTLGGDENEANGDFSLAAGQFAKANHNGAFVWADNGNTNFESTAPQQFLIRAAGGVGIGTNAPSEALHVNGNALADAHTTPSSRRWKTNIQTIDNALETVQELRGVTYDWKETGKRDVGLIAEEVGAVIPEIVAYEENGVDAKSVDYPRLVAVLIEAVKELKQENDALNKQVVALNGLEAKVARIETALRKMNANTTVKLTTKTIDE